MHFGLNRATAWVLSYLIKILSMASATKYSIMFQKQGSIPESYREHEKRLPHPGKAAGAQIIHSRHGEVVMGADWAASLGPQLRYANEDK